MEVVIADGVSTDQTRQQIQNFQRQHQELVVRVVENVKRTIPSGLNAAIRAAQGQIIIRLDAHSIPYPDYIAQCFAALQAGCGDNVGGVWEILPGSQMVGNRLYGITCVGSWRYAPHWGRGTGSRYSSIWSLLPFTGRKDWFF
jgi:glycosyltransferase involved in cell wall biosynthesis